MTRVRDIEDRVGVDRVDVLLAERARLVAQAAPLRAKRDVFDAARKARRAAVAALIEAEKGTTMAEARLERLSSGDRRYCEWLEARQLEFAELVLLEDKINAVNERLRRADACLRFATAEARLAQ